LSGGSQHRGQVPAQLDPEPACLRTQDNRIDQPAERLGRLDSGVRTLEGCGKLSHLRAVDVRHLRVQQRGRLVRDLQLCLELILPVPDRD
jgi:hypothetical protein